jgi:hypothetical protein
MKATISFPVWRVCFDNGLVPDHTNTVTDSVWKEILLSHSKQRYTFRLS